MSTARPLGYVETPTASPLFGMLASSRFAPTSLSELPNADGVTFYAVPVANQIHDLGRVLSSIDPLILDAQRNGRLILILDHSGENGAATNKIMDAWYAALHQYALLPRNIIYVAQDVSQAKRHTRRCEETGITEPVTVGRHHSFLKQLSINNRIADEKTFEAREATYLRRTPERRALCLMHKVRPIRIRLALELLQRDLWNSNLISWGGIESEDRRLDLFERDHGYRPPHFLDVAKEGFLPAHLMGSMEALLAIPRTLLDGDDPYNKPDTSVASLAASLIEPPHLKTGFSIVSETEMMPRQCRFTEKSIRPFANYHAAIVFGNYQTLSLIRSFGFATFADEIDEAYDDIADRNTRFEAAIAEVTRLCNMPADDFAGLLKRLQPVVAANARHFHFGLPDMIERKLDAPLIAQLEEMAASANLALTDRSATDDAAS